MGYAYIGTGMGIPLCMDSASISSEALCRAVGLTYRQLDYWTRLDIITPAIPATGSGSGRRFTEDQVAPLRLAVILRDHGAGLNTIRPVIGSAMELPPSAWWGRVIVRLDGTITRVDTEDAEGWVVDLGKCMTSAIGITEQRVVAA